MSEKKLVSLEDFNKATNQQAWAEKANAPSPNGIACPECEEELYDSCPDIVLTSFPAQKNIHCVKCGYRGYRYC